MGWDAFGLPAEQHAIATNTHPSITTKKNIETYKRQMQMLGLSYDWDREIDTTDPEYFRWTQWIFLKLFERGLAVQANVPVNWCPSLGTVLSNEEVIDGKSERGSFPVERIPLRQWQLMITQYADRLEEDLELVDWPPDTKVKQRQWIGKSAGFLVRFGIEGAEADLEVFTTRVDTLAGATYCVIAPEHPFTLSLVDARCRERVEAYVAASRSKSDLQRTELAKFKTGVPLGRAAINPINGRRIPIWVGDYVLGHVGTGAVMGVPAHDARDFEFAQQYGLPIVQVVAPRVARDELVGDTALPFVDEGVLLPLDGHLQLPNGTTSAQAREAIGKWLEENGRGSCQVNYKLRDWVFSRQRYWGEPIPIYFPVECDGDPREPNARYVVRYDRPIPMKESELPLRLPDLKDFKPTGSPEGPLASAIDWRFFQVNIPRQSRGP
jgi:leucyl-tRNA synthetase